MTNFPNDPNAPGTPSTPFSPPPNAPPTSDQFAYQSEPEPPKWPKVVGIFSIVWASIGLACGLCGLLQMVAGAAFQPQLPGGGGAGGAGGGGFQPPPPSAMLMISSVLGMFPPIVLLIAGIFTVQRKAAGRMLHLVYAGLSVIVTIIGTLVAVQAIDTMIQTMEQQAASQGDPNAAAQIKNMIPMMKSFSTIGIVLGGVLGVAYPIFVAIWFGVVKRDNRELTQPVGNDVM